MIARFSLAIAVGLTLQVIAVSAHAQGWRTFSENDGLRIETRELNGLPFGEIRLMARSDASVQTLCDVVWEAGEPGEQASNIKLRQVIEQRANVRVTYEQVKVPVVTDRDYVVQTTRKVDSNHCEVVFENVDNKGPAPKKDHVRVPKFFGSWSFTPAGDGSVVMFTIYSDPGGGVPAALAKGPQRDSAIIQMRTMLERARTVETRASLP